MARAVVPVLVPVALEGPFSYRVPADMTVAPGAIVHVPFGPRQVIGVVWDGTPDGSVGDNRLRDIIRVYDCPPIGPDLRRFVDWVAHYYLAPRGQVLRMVLRAPEALDPEPSIPGVRRAGAAPERLTTARQRVLQLIDEGFAWSKSGLAASAGVSSSVIDGLIGAGTLEAAMLPPPAAVARPEPDYCPAALNAEQTIAADHLVAAIEARRYAVTLLDGVTGSGKTETFFEAIAATLRQGRQAVVMMPEIALTGAVLARFEARFGARPGEWHSDVAPRQRARLWRGLANGDVQVVVGARSSLFLPFRDLGLIVVDEEHDTAYKQEDRVPYNARDMAVVRGHIGGFPVILASATPSIETKANALAGRYAEVTLSERAGDARLPRLSTVDLRRHKPEFGRFLSPLLCEEVDKTLDRGEQALLFLNRRGYAPLTLCRSCGHRFQCPQCTTWMVEHRFRGVLMCHCCGHSIRTPQSCPACGDLDSLVACGPGVERIAEEVAERFAGRRTLVLSSDTPGGTARLRLELESIARGEVDLIIGTQLVAKGHNFPGLALVGVVDADLGLANGDPRAAERTFQMLAQVTGRAGRFSGEGRGLLQTHAPDHPVIKAIVAGDRDGFYAHELQERRLAGLPPYGRLAALVVSADTRDAAHAFARAVAANAPADPDFTLYGPVEAPIAVIRGRHRFRMLLKAPRAADMQAYLTRWLAATPKEQGGRRLHVDIDPQSFL